MIKFGPIGKWTLQEQDWFVQRLQYEKCSDAMYNKAAHSSI